MGLLRARGCLNSSKSDFRGWNYRFASQKQTREKCVRTTGSALTPVIHSNKAVAVGAISYYVDHFVTGRISKFTYGVPCNTPYQPSKPEHVRREYTAFYNATGGMVLPSYFDTMLSRVCQPSHSINTPREFHCSQGTKVLEDREVRHSFCYVTEGTPRQQASQQVSKYTGASSSPEWMDVEPGQYV